MKIFYMLLILMISTVSAQEHWGDPELIFLDPTGTGLKFEPCFSSDPDEILLTYPLWDFSTFRIMKLYLDSPYDPEPFLADSLSVEGYNDASPFIAFDRGRLYFTSNRPGGFGGYDIWMTESIGNDWIMPVNLGNEINTDLDETCPSVTADGSELYFLRGVYEPHGGYYSGDIYCSQFTDNQWQEADALPPQINSDSDESDPSISADGDKLYFISLRPNDLQGDAAVWTSLQIGGTWSEPTLPTGAVNEYWQECGFWLGHPMSVKIDSTGMNLLYVKLGMFDCFELETRIFIAHHATNVGEEIVSVPDSLSLTVYPNPFNSSLFIRAEIAGSAKLDIFDPLGRKVRSFYLDPGNNSIVWDGADGLGNGCPSGIYFMRLNYGRMDISRTVILLK